MRIMTHKENKDGTRTVTIRLEKHETVMALDDRMHYRLGGQVEDVVAVHVLAEAGPVYWCSIQQKWVEA